MKKNLMFLAILVFTGWMLAPIPPSSQHAGAYNYTSHLMYCRTELACLHEIGHRLDQEAGYISQSPEFYKALQMYLYTEMRKPQLTEMPVDIMQLTYQGKDRNTPIKQEIYAYLFAWACGKAERLPEGLRSFYDWEEGARLMKYLRPNQRLYWLG